VIVKHEKPKAKEEAPKLKMPSRKGNYMPLTPITPDRHSGRIFTSLLPDKGEFVLPIRGERVLKTSEEIDIEHDISDKAEQLRRLIEQIKTGETYKGLIKEKTVAERPAFSTEPRQPLQSQFPAQKQPVLEPMVPASPAEDKGVKVNAEAEGVIEAIKSENARLSAEIEKLKLELNKSQQDDTAKQAKLHELETLQTQKAHISTDFSKLQTTVKELQEKITEKQQISLPTYANMQPLTNRANIISGVVKSVSNKALDGVVLIIKNQKGEPVRALKTNSLGQFSISTPLVNGNYTIEIDSSNKTGFSFDIISIELKGEVIPPIEFVGK
jgi:hypothetical protein